MDTCFLASAARALGTSAPRVRRAIGRHGMAVKRAPSGTFLLTQQQADELARILGSAPAVPGMSLPDLRVLAALSRSPRGVVSIREAARRAGISPAATSRSLKRLASRQLITATPTLIARGHVVEVVIYVLRFGSAGTWLQPSSTCQRRRHSSPGG